MSHTRASRHHALLAAGLVAIASAYGQTLVVQTGAPLSAGVTAKVGGRSVAVNIAPLQRTPELTVVLVQNALLPVDYPEIRKFITAVARQTRSAVPVRIDVLRPESVLDSAGPFHSAAELQTVLRKTVPDESLPATLPSLSIVLADAASALAATPSAWGYTLLVARSADTSPPELNRYIAAWATRQFIAQKRTLLFWNPAGQTSSQAAVAISRDTGGSDIAAVEDVAAVVNSSGYISALTLEGRVPSRGVELLDVVMAGVPERAPFTTAVISAASPSAVISVAEYTELRALTAGTATRADIDRALKLNPADAEALKLGIDLAARTSDVPFGIALLETAVELSPADASLWTALGHLQYGQKDFKTAETSLQRAKELGPLSAASLEELGRIRYALQDLPQALANIEASLQLDASQQALWFFAADIAQQLPATERQAAFLERGLALGTDLKRREALIRIYLEAGDTQRAAQHVDIEASRLPADANTQAMWATFEEKLSRPDRAVQNWQNAIAADPKRDDAYYAIASIHSAAGRWAEALAISERGLEVTPSSAGLELVEVTSLDRLNRIYDARRSLDRFASGSSDSTLLRKAAEMSDAFGGDAAGAYRRLAEAMQKSGAPKAEMDPVMASGRRVAARDGDVRNIEWFQPKEKQPEPLVRTFVVPPTDTEVWVPGGIDALSFVVQGHNGSTPESFLVDYCRTLIAHFPIKDSPESVAYRRNIAGYFEGLRQLQLFSVRTGDMAVLTLGIATRPELQKTEAVLTVLGWRIRRVKQKLTVESNENKGESQKQELASALAIDQGAMQDAFGRGKAFRIEIPFEKVRVTLGFNAWAGLKFDRMAGGLAEALSQNPGYARAYLALSNVDKPTASALAYEVGLQNIAGKYADLLSLDSAALAIANGHVVVPGGVQAEPVWMSLCGASPAQPARFFRALFDKDDGKLLAWFYALSQLDVAHQRFFTLNPARTLKFYQAFTQSPDMQPGAGKMIRNGKFSDFLREIPLVDNSVDFPGSAEVWMVAKGKSTADQSQRMLRKVRKAVAPALEDTILLRLANMHYQADNEHVSELDNFLAVKRIDEHRSEPLDEDSALILAQNYSAFSSVYPYFSEFISFRTADYQNFFSLLTKMKTADLSDAEIVLGQFYPLLEIARLAKEFGGIPEATATAAVRRLCTRLLVVGGLADATSATLDAVRELTAAANAGADADGSVERLVLGPREAVEIEWNGSPILFEPEKDRGVMYRRVLELQKAPAIAALLRMDDAVRHLATGNEAYAPHIAGLQKDAALLPALEIPKTVKFEGSAHQSILRISPAKISPLLAELQQKTLKKKVNAGDVQKIAKEVLTELAPQVGMALEGVVYAVYLRPSDVLVANDPLLLRKHQSIELRSDLARRTRFPESGLQQENTAAGSYFYGGFGQFSTAAIAATTVKNASAGTNLYNHQISSIRMTPFSRYTDNDQIFLGLSIRIAREWCVYAADDPALLTALADDTAGLLSLSRRRDLLTSVAAKDWPRVWRSVTASDLLFLAGRYLERFPKNSWGSPAEAAYRRMAALSSPARLELLGPLPAGLYGCNHPHLVRLAPYEEYERHLFPSELSERTAEMKIYLSNALDRYAVPAAAMPIVSENAAYRTFGAIGMSDERDWASAIRAFSAIDAQTIGLALKGQK